MYVNSFFLFAKYAISLCDYFWFEGRILVIVSSVVYFSFEYFVETDLFTPNVHGYKFLINIVYVFPIVAVVFIKWNELILAIWWCITVWVTFLALGKCLVLLHAEISKHHLVDFYFFYIYKMVLFFECPWQVSCVMCIYLKILDIA